MMKIIKFKSINIIFILLISIFIFIPKVYAGMRTNTYTNYYLFLELYDISDQKGNNEIHLAETINDTAFYRLNYNYDNTNLTRVKLKQTVTSEEKENDTAWTYEDFYDKYNKISDPEKTNRKSYKINNPNGEEVYCYSDFSKKTNSTKEDITYFTHGCYKNHNNGNWKGNKNDPSSYDPPIDYACASFDRDTTANFEPSGNDFLSTTITRDKTTLKSNQITWDSNLSTNLSNCGGKIHPKGGKTVYNPVVYKYTYTVTEYFCDETNTNNGNNKCNSNTKIENNCNRKTITTENSVGEVEITQKMSLNNILTPDSIYQGGGFKFGIVYQNTVSWDLIKLVVGSETEIEAEMQKKLKRDFTPLLTLNFTDEYNNSLGSLDSGTINRQCTSVGSFKRGDTLTTTCTFFLPNAILDNYTGEVNYSISSGTNYGINNKYYTPLNYAGNYYITATLTSLNRLTGLDGMTPNNDWTVTLNDKDDCKINVYKRLYNIPEGSNNNKYSFAFIYRPINIMDPFPNRNPGINWFKWYSISNNRERLEESYKNIHYIATLDNISLQKIKNYNADQSNSGGYSDWNFDANGNSEFINEFVERVGGN